MEPYEAESARPDENQKLRSRIAELEAELARLRRSNPAEDPAVTVIRQLMEDAPVAFAFLNTEFRYEVVNRKLAEMNGVPAASHIGHTVDEIVPEVAAAARRVFDRVMTTGQALLDVEFKGTRHWSASWYPIHTAEGRLLGVGALIADVTPYKQALEELRRNEQRLHLAQSAAGVASWEWDLQTNELFCSPEYGPLYGLPPITQAPRYDRWLQLLHPEDRERIDGQLSRVLAGLGEYLSEFRVVWPDGSIHWLMGKGRVSRDSEGKPTRVFGVNMDITQRKQAEQAVRESEERFRSMADAASLMIVAAGKDGRANFFNKGWLLFTGRSMEQQLGDGWIEDVHPEDRDRTLAQIASSFEKHLYCQAEYRLRRADGEYRWILCNGGPRFDADGTFTGYVGSAFDITEYKRAHEEALARQKLESIGVVAGGVAHDLNNLLGGILAESELLEGNLSADSVAIEGVKHIKLVAGRAAGIARELLAYAAREDTASIPVDLSKLVTEMLDLWRVSISKRAALKADLSPNLAAVRANPSQLWQVVLNLLTNASEALGGRDGTIAISTGPVKVTPETAPGSVAALPSGDYIRLQISDTGSGMTEEVCARIFDPFFTTKLSGRGFGLAVVQGIVRSHGGAIHVTSTPGVGSTFEVLLPAYREAAAEKGAVLQRNSDSPPPGGGTVLLVEDETSLRVPISKMLQRRGYTVMEAENGQSAIEIFRAHASEIGVVLLDLTLPGRSGAEVFADMHGIQPRVKVILTSAYSEEKVLNDLAGRQSWGFLRKPYQFGDLVNLLQRAMVHEAAS